MKLEVGMYVRIQWSNGEQTISKCTNKVDMGDTQYSNNDFYIHTDKKGEVIYKSMILKASHNIIDLIEVGDYVNGIRVGYINKGEDYLYALTDENTRDVICGYDSDEFTKPLHSIVTKEQFESIKYSLEG